MNDLLNEATATNYQQLVAPKLNVIYSPTERTQWFINAGSGFHSNDARSVVKETQHALPVAWSAETGVLFHPGNRWLISAVLWQMEMKQELVYIGDEGTTESKGSSRRRGVDLSTRYKLSNRFAADLDVNVSQNYFTQKLFGARLNDSYEIPLAPTMTSTGGLTTRLNHHLEVSLRYRYIATRPANEDNTIQARGYSLADMLSTYTAGLLRFTLSVENLLNTKWNEAQFDTESRLKNETTPVSELHFTPGTPTVVKFSIAYSW